MAQIHLLLKQLRDQEIGLKLKENDLELSMPDHVDLDTETIQTLKKHKGEIIAYLKSITTNSGYDIIEKTPEKEKYPVTSSQHRFWVVSQFEGANDAYTISNALRLQGTLIIEHLEKAFTLLLKRHESLRSYFKSDLDGNVYQYIASLESINFQLQTISANSQADEDKAVANFFQKSFNLATAPLLNAQLIQTHKDEYILLFKIHHIIGDGWSMQVITNEIMELYMQLCTHGTANLPELRIQYKDYVAWTVSEKKQQQLQAQEAYWLRQFEEVPSIVQLPSSKTRPAVKTFEGDTCEYLLSDALYNTLQNYTKTSGYTVFMVLMAGLKGLFYRYTSNTDITFGIPIAGREHPDVHNQIGLFINTLAIRTKLDGKLSFAETLAIEKEQLIGAYANQEYPFDSLLEKIEFTRDASRSPLFDIMVVLQNQEQQSTAEETHTELEMLPYEKNVSGVSQFDMTFTFQDIENAMLLTVEFNKDIYEKAFVENLIANFERYVTSGLAQPTQHIGNIPFLSQEEKNRILYNFSQGETLATAEGNILTLFQQQVTKQPNAQALVYATKIISYQELDETSNQLANYLLESQHVQKGDFVAILLSQNEWIVIAMLATLKAGAAYVPIDVEYPETRKAYIISDSQCSVTINEDMLHDFQQKSYASKTPEIAITADDLSYVIYTSGSTGNPKGVMITHGGLYHSTVVRNEVYRPCNAFLLLSSIGFDSSVAGLYGTICFGGTLHVLDKDTIKDIHQVATYIEKNNIDRFLGIPSYVQLVAETFSTFPLAVQDIIVAGEKSETQFIDSLLEKDTEHKVTVFNEYGPTEGTVWSTYQQYKKGDIIFDTIGRPIPNVSCYILNDALALQPVGVIGELCISGSGLARGYVGRTDLTASKFIENPFVEGERLYLTGDLARWREDGSIEFIGRKDSQVKLNGYRIELGEIEHQVLSFEGVEKGVVLLNKEYSSLVCYVKLVAGFEIKTLRTHLSAVLPNYMLPGYFIEMETFPLTANGKIDTSNLPSIDAQVTTKETFVAPTTEKEQILATVWTTVLGISQIGKRSDFYHLGGDSIKSIQVVSRLKQHGYELRVGDILRYPILEDLAPLLTLGTATHNQSMIEGEVGLTPIQQYFFESDEIAVKHHYNQSAQLSSKERLDKEILTNCLEVLTKHHDAIRMRYYVDQGKMIQYNVGYKPNKYQPHFYDLRETTNWQEELATICEDLQSSFDVSKGHLFQIAHFQLADSDHLVFIAHHLIIDGVSWRILLEDFTNVYNSLANGEAVTLPSKTTSYSDWFKAQQTYVAQGLLTNETNYWQTVCALLSEKYLPKTLTNASQIILDATQEFTLSETQTAALQRKIHTGYNTNVNDILLSSLSLSLQEVFSIDRCLIELEGHGREELTKDIDLSRTVGWFTSLYPFELQAKSNDAIATLITTKEALRKIPNRGIGYSMLQYLSEEFEADYKPLLLFNYLGDFGSGVESNETDASQASTRFEYGSYAVGNDRSLKNTSHVGLEVTGIIVSGELSISIRYSKAHYSADQIQKLEKAYTKQLTNYIDSLSNIQETHLTPSDLSYNEISIKELAKLTAETAIADIYELSPLQEGMYYHWLSSEQNELYFEQMSYSVSALDIPINYVEEAYNDLIARYEVLRTGFRNDIGGTPLQIVHQKVHGDFRYHEAENSSVSIEDLKIADREEGFNLSASSLMRLQVYKTSEGSYEFLWSHHHILIDGWCMSILINDFYELIRSKVSGNTPDLPKVLPYARYINWLRSVDKQSSLNYWNEVLSGYEGITRLPMDKQSVSETYTQSHIDVVIPQETYNALKSVCATYGFTQNTFIQGVWSYLISRYTQRKDVVYGSVVSGRPSDLEGVETMVGLFINTIPVRVELDETDTAKSLLSRIQEGTINSNGHHYLNLSEIQSYSNTGRHLVDHILMFGNYLVEESRVSEVVTSDQNDTVDMEVSAFESYERTNYNFYIQVAPDESLSLRFVYNESRYSSEYIQRLSENFKTLLTSFIESPEAKLTTLNYVSKAEQTLLLEQFASEDTSHKEAGTIIDRFEEIAKKYPNNTAVVFEGESLTYQELDAQSNQLAHYLRSEHNIDTEDLVGILLDRSHWMIVSILGILKAGAAYVPIDPNYPEARKEYMITDSNCKAIIDEVLLHNFQHKKYPTTKLKQEIKPNHLAYVIYTSGSTGNPKGVLIPHKNVFKLFFNNKPLFDFTDKDVWSLFHSYCFDFSVWEMYGALFFGGKLLIPTNETVRDTAAFSKLAIAEGLTVLNQTPSSFQVLQEAILTHQKKHSIRYVIFGGEALYPSFLEEWKRTYPACQIINMYGITETTVHTTFKEINPTTIHENLSVVGRPIPNVSCYILNDALALQPVGVIGELCISGSGLARGYVGRADLTASKFIENPFAEGERLYLTGDLARWREDGSIEFIGRKDSQVKLNGYRIELGEIEHQVLSFEGVEKGVVLLNKEYSSLVCYVKLSLGFEIKILRTHLSAVLPNYMLPGYFIEMDTFPLTANGKIDTSNLPNIDAQVTTQETFVAPTTEKEQILATIWTTVLGISQIGKRSDFYHLGGDSIKSIQVVSRLKQHGYELRVGDILRYPILEDLALLLTLSTAIHNQSTVEGEVGLTPIQQYFFESEEIAIKHHYNQSAQLSSKERLDKEILTNCLEVLTKHHDALRMRYYEDAGKMIQYNVGFKPNQYQPHFYDLRETKNWQEELATICEDLQSSFDVSKGHLFQMAHFQLADSDHLVFIAHHLIIDGVSWRILLEDFTNVYNSLANGEKVTLPSKTTSYSDWFKAQQTYVAQGLLTNETNYWQTVCALPSEKYLPKTLTNASQITLDATQEFALSETQTAALQRKIHTGYNTNVNDILLSSLSLSLQQVFSIDRCLIELEGHGREELTKDIDLSRTVGWFTSLYPFELHAKSNDAIATLITTKEALRKIPNRGIGYSMLQYLSEEFEADYKPLLLFNYLGDFGSGVESNETDTAQTSTRFEYGSYAVGNDRSPENTSHVGLEVTGIIVSGELSISIRYSKAHYTTDQIEKLEKAYAAQLTNYTDSLSNIQETHLTPSDLSYAEISIEELTKLTAETAIADIYELSPLQEGMYYHWLSSEQNELYFEQMSYSVSSLDIPINYVEEAYNDLLARYEVLRTGFRNDIGGTPLQIVHQKVQGDFRYHEAENSSVSIEDLKIADRQEGFDLSASSLMRLQVYKTSEGSYEFLWSHHHILIDGWCMSILINDFYELIRSKVSGNMPDLPKVLPYSRYINWLRGVDKQSSLNYWNEVLSGYEGITRLPMDKQSVSETYTQSHIDVVIPQETYSALKSVCATYGFTQNTFIQGVWSYLISRYRQRKDVVYGSVVSGRPSDLEGVETMVGLFINTIPVRVELDETDTVKSLLSRIQEGTINSNGHHYLNLSEIQSYSNTGRHLVDHILMFGNYLVEESRVSEVATSDQSDTVDMEVSAFESYERTNYNFYIQVAPDESLSLRFVYNESCYSSEYIARLSENFKTLLTSFIESPEAALTTLNYVSKAEQTLLLESFASEDTRHTEVGTIIDRFEEIAKKYPNNTAVVFEGESLTYQELDAQSNQLAHYLRSEHNIGTEDLVGILLDRSHWMIVSILGILKAGAAYVPIDPNYPEARKEYILQETKAKLLITSTDYMFDIYYFEETILAIDVETEFLQMSTQKPSVAISQENMAYVLFTSGSTGKPKGAILTHEAVLNTALAEKETFKINANERCLQFASFAFDASVWETFLALLSGASLHITTEDTRKNPEQLLSYILTNEITVATMPPSYLRLIPVHKLTTLNTLITAGEQVTYEDIAGFETIGNYYNAYGLTETSICTSIHKVRPEEYQQTGPIPIGNPIRNMSYYVLQDNIICPVGVAGELCIGGIGLAKGYYNNEQLTSEKFVDNPFVPSERMYKTGDLVRWRSDGTIEFLGRIDDQVKLRGYRIELGAIESSLSSHTEIRESVALVRELAGQQELIAYYVSDSALEVVALRNHIATNLPQYMLPTHYVHVLHMPLTPNGKIAKKKLPNPEIIAPQEDTFFREATTETEKRVVAIWEEILGRERIGLDDDFFVLGGHSLRATRLLNKFHKEFEVRLELGDLFTATTVAAQVTLLSSAANTTYEEIPKLEEQEDYAVSSGQHRLWILSQFKEGSLAYHMPNYVYLEGNYDVAKFQKAVQAVVKRHEILRTVFKQQTSGEVRQRVISADNYNLTINFEDFSQHENSELAFENFRRQDAQLAFDLENGPLFRCSLLQLSDRQYAFYFNMHHIISDGWSMDVLRNDVLKYYQQFHQGLASGLQPLRIQYKDYSQWQRTQSEGAAQLAAQTYWKEQFQGELPIFNLPTTKRRPKVKTYNGQMLESVITNETYTAIQNFVAEHGGSMFMVLLSSWQAIFYCYAGLRDQIIGTPTSGRTHKELENQIGFYINTLALRNTLEEGDSFATFYERITQNTLESFNHQAYPFDRLVDDLQLNYDTSRSALFDVLLTLNQDNDAVAETETIAGIREAGQTMAKFDIEISFLETEGQLSYVFIYNEDVYDAIVMRQLMTHYELLLSKLLTAIDTNIDHIVYLETAEKEALISHSETGIVEGTMLSDFARQVAKHPENTAIIFEEVTLTYKELDELSNQFAHYLVDDQKVVSGELIALQLDRSEKMIIAILGVLKSGAAYVPIDPTYPQERIAYIEADTKCNVSIDEAVYATFTAEQEKYAKTQVAISPSADDLAYVIYTSGSTGKPKGVMIAHKNAVSMLQWAQNEFATTAFDVMYFVTSYCFDLSVYELFYPLSTGKSIRILENGLAIANYVEKDTNIAINTVPSVIEALISQQISWENVVAINMAGEPIPLHVANALPLDRVEVRNLYGPSEDTTYSSYYRIESTVTADAIPIGKPIEHTQFYILSEGMQLQPDYVEGELYIAGAGLAKGYLNKEKLTQERFIPNPFKKGEFLYKTGDIVRRLHDGNVVYRRRSDHQIKLRGYRIELGEIEQVIQQVETVNQVVVVVKQVHEVASITAYFVADVAMDTSQLRNFISERLPEYMVPSYYMQLPELPRNANGKIDRNNLPEIDASAVVRNQYVAPETETQQKLVTLWEALLNVETIGIEDDFFALGGNSIKAMQLITNIQEMFEVTIDIANVFLRPNITQLAIEIEKSLWYDDSFDEDEIIDSEII